jgi:hypothetical protein
MTILQRRELIRADRDGFASGGIPYYVLKGIAITIYRSH